MTEPAISVVMPAYNAERYIAEAIDSILNQTYSDFELIIVNDGSKDKTEEIILSYSDNRIKYLKNEANQGICRTLNKGIDAAKGRYIARMDSDDISLPSRLGSQFIFMERHSNIVAAGSDIIIFGEGISPYLGTMLHPPQECKAGLLFNSCFAHPSVIIRKEILEKEHLIYKDEYKGLEDFELWWQLSKYGDLANIHQPLLKYRRHPQQETHHVSDRVEKIFKDFIKIRFLDLDIKLNDYEINLIQKYSRLQYNRFTEQELLNYINLCIRIHEQYPSTDSKELNAVKITLAKSISYIAQNSSLPRSGYYYIKLAFHNRIIPISWMGKIILHKILNL